MPRKVFDANGNDFRGLKIPLRKWLATVWIITSHKKGIASTQLAKDIDMTPKEAHMVHVASFASGASWRTRSFNRPLRGEVEADETFIGGKDEENERTA